MFLQKICLTVLSVLIIVFWGQRNTGSGKLLTNKIHPTSQTTVSPCPEDNETNRAIMKEFLTKLYWQKERQETNTAHLTASQIALLYSPNYKATCKQLNDRFQGFISETWPNGTPTYNITYYKVGAYFFVLISLRPSEDPGAIVDGKAFLVVYDQNMNRLKGYAF